MLETLDFEDSVIDRVCYLIAHHHTYTDINGLDYQILVEADFLVNLYEGNESRETAGQVLRGVSFVPKAADRYAPTCSAFPWIREATRE